MNTQARVGDVVYYFANLTDQAPKAALVTAVYSADHVSLSVIEGGRLDFKQTVHNRNSEMVKNNQRLGAIFGVWDFRDPPEVRTALNELVYGADTKTEKTEKKQTAKV